MKRWMNLLILAGTGTFLVFGSPPDMQTQAQQFLEAYTAQYLALYYESSLAEWDANTKIIEGDTTIAHRSKMANEALAKFTGSRKNIESAQKFLDARDQLTPLQVRQFEEILYMAANYPEIVEDVVKARVAAETDQNQKLFGFDFKINGESVSTNDIDEILRDETQLEKRLQAWRASKEVGKVLKEGLVDLQNLRNQTVQALGYADYFSYQVSDYGMTTAELRELLAKIIREIYPLYRELHTYARYELAEKYGAKEVPDMLPAHWLPNRWGQDWNAMVTVEGVDLDGALKNYSPERLVQQAERFYISLGFSPLPQSFWEKSSLYPLPPDANYKKNNHASAWHLDLQNDIRCLMSVIPNADWYETTHHELGHIYYYVSYTNPNVPPLLREGANRAFHEGVGSLMGLAAMQKPFIGHLNLIPADIQTDEMQQLLKEALNYIIFIPWSAGVMSEFEYDLYANKLPANEFNKRWWELKKKYQGITPPTTRGEEYCDAASKTHINNDAAQYYDYALSYILLFQLHDHIAGKILQQNPHATNYYGNKEIGKFLKNILKPGATRDWREVLRETTGEEMSARAMLKYFEPLMEYLKEKNQGRKYTLQAPEKL